MILEGCTKTFRRGSTVVNALNDVNVTVQKGKITGLLGPDGAGKTTLMRLAATLLLPERGRVLVLDRDTRTAAMDIQNVIGYMPQRFGLYEDLTVQENLDLYAALQGLSQKEKHRRQQELLALTALGRFGGRRAGQLSGGMKQKLGLACALLRAPQLLLLDEPTVGVDPISRRELWSIIEGLRAQGLSVIFSTAYLDEAERCDEVLLLHEGHILAQNNPVVLKAPLVGRCYLVQNEALSRRQLQSKLGVRSGIIDATVQSEGVRVICQTPGPKTEGNEQWTSLEPRFEDAFVTLLHTKVASGPSITPSPVAKALRSHGIRDNLPAGPVIEVASLRRLFGDFEAVKGISFTVQRGEIFGLLGANGAGKTTTFNMLCGLLSPSSGTLRVAGQDLHRAVADARSHIGYVSQKFSLYGNLSVIQNLQFFSAVYGLRGAQRKARIDWALDEFNFESYAKVNGNELPLGFKQRLALACALLHEPTILFLDEPTSGVDPLARREFWARINQLAESGVTVLITTHFMDEAEYCDQLVLMSLGEILAQGNPKEIRAQAGSLEIPHPTMEDAFIILIRNHEAHLRSAS